MASRYNGGSALGTDRWKVQIMRKGKVFYLGSYDDELHAARIADETNLLTDAWKGKNTSLNFNDSRKPAEESINEPQRNLLQWLRLNFPEDERRHRKESLVDQFLPDVMIEHLDHAILRVDTLANEITRTLKDAKISLRAQALQLSEKEKRIVWLNARVLELEKNPFEHRPSPAGPYTITPVVPEAKVVDVPVIEVPVTAPIEVTIAPRAELPTSSPGEEPHV